MGSIIRHKGKALTLTPNEFCVIDLETTGLHPQYDSILEMSAIKYRNNQVVDKFDNYVAFDQKIPEFVQRLTGITSEFVKYGIPLDDLLDQYLTFIGNDVVVGHNVNFDLNFIYDYSLQLFGLEFQNSYIDTMRLGRKLLPQLSHCRLSDLCEVLNVTNKRAHQSWADCEATFDCLRGLYELGVKRYGSLDAFAKECQPRYRIPNYANFNPKNLIVTDNTKKDPTNLLFGRHVCFTGALDKLGRKDAAQLVVNIGGVVDNNVTRKTNYLVLGDNSHCYMIKDGKSSKQKKAEAYIARGYDLQILPESVFYQLVLGD